MDELIFKLNGVQLVYSPDGWDDSIIQRGRHDTYFSLKSQFTTQLSFVKDGADILKNIFNSQGFEGVCELKIEQLDPNTWTYYNIFTGNLDFSTYVFEEPFVKISSAEDSFWEMIKANEKTEYEIDIESNNPVTINATFPYLLQKRGYTVNCIEHVGSQIIAMSEILDETYLFDSSSLDQTQINITTFPLSLDKRFAYVNAINPEINFKMKVTGLIYSNMGGTFSFYISNQDSSIIRLIYTTSRGGSAYNQYISFDIDNDIFGIGTGGLFLFCSMSAYSTDKIISLSGDFEFSYLGIPKDKSIKSLRPITVLNQLLTKMNNNVPISIKYNTFMGILNDYLFLCGNSLRGIQGAKLKISFENFINWCNCTFTTGFGFENNQVVLNYLSYFFQDTEIANFGEIGNLKLEIYKTHIVNNFKIGYEEKTYDDVNGKYEVNQSQEWTLPISKISKQGDYISLIRSDVMGIIFACLNLEGKTTTDSDSDNDIFCLHSTTNSGVTTLWRDNTYMNLGVIGGNRWFNVNLTPKRNLLRKGAFLNSFLHNIIGEITFQSGTKNTEFQSRFAGETAYIKESDPILINSLPSRLFLPYICTVKSIIEKDLNISLLQNPNGYISFIYKGNVFKGFINELGINPGKKTEYEVKLIMHPDTDLTLLI